mmetsp:Transcript_35594/g.94144  ORF Transcript_35594/g.94144 Transcript_35594/m.94144 type:complete len:218 (-) Transcript_35594:831-1484(-)
MPSALIARAARNRICRSGLCKAPCGDDAAAAGVRKKPPWSQPVEVRGPRPWRAQSSRGPGCGSAVPATRSFEVTETPLWLGGHSKETTAAGWSCKFMPTAGTSLTTSIPCSFRWLAGPTPESIRSCGEWRAPPVRRTSPPLANRTMCSSPPAANATPAARGRPSAPSAKTTRRADAIVRTWRRLSGSASAGSSNAEAAEQRAPFRSETGNRPAPSCD